MNKVRKKRTGSSVKWIGGGICMGICLWITHVHGLELGGFEVEVQTGESMDLLQWWENNETSEENKEQSPEAGSEEKPEEDPEKDTEPEMEQSPEQNPEQGSEPGMEVGHAEESEIPHIQVQQQQTENVQKEVREQKRKKEQPETILVPDISKVPVEAEKKKIHKKIKQNFSVDFIHPDVPGCLKEPGVQIKSEGQVGILSVRHNGQECLWYWKGDELLWEADPCKGENRIEILAVTEDCRLICMEPWIYKT